MANRVSQRGQITLDRAVRKELNIQPGMMAYQRVVDGHVEVVFLPESHKKSLYGAFQSEAQSPITTSNELEEAVMAAIAAERGQS